MKKLLLALRDIKSLDQLAEKDQWMNRLHPLVKLFITLFYIFLTVSYLRYDILGLLGMAVYPVMVYIAGELSVFDALRRFFIVLPFVFLVGAFNPFFDRVPIVIMGIATTSGVISMITLALKGIFSLLASYALIATTGIERICYALRLLHVPKIIVTEILLIYRYIILLLEDNHRVIEAYSLRAPGQKGIHLKAWGSLAGLMLLRSMDRAGRLYEAMVLRGYTGDFEYHGKAQTFKKSDAAYLAFWIIILVGLRRIPVFAMLL